MKWFARGVVAIATLGPRLAVPITATACDVCPEDGSAIVLDHETVLRAPAIVVDGDACTAKSVACIHRDAADRCDSFWITPSAAGTCVISLRFSDENRLDNVITYERDDTWPCKGHLEARGESLRTIRAGT